MGVVGLGKLKGIRFFYLLFFLGTLSFFGSLAYKRPLLGLDFPSSFMFILLKFDEGALHMPV
jgi:hypothetical protein